MTVVFTVQELVRCSDNLVNGLYLVLNEIMHGPAASRGLTGQQSCFLGLLSVPKCPCSFNLANSSDFFSRGRSWFGFKAWALRFSRAFKL